MIHPARISIYKTEKSYFIVPSWYDNGGYLGIGPIRIVSTNSSLEELGQNLLNAVSDCRHGDTDYSQNSFKELLKVTKARSENKLMKIAKYVGVTFLAETIEFQLFRIDTNIKCWSSSKEDRVTKKSDIGISEITQTLLDVLSEKWVKQNISSNKLFENSTADSIDSLDQAILNDQNSSAILDRLREAGYFDFVDNNSIINDSLRNYATSKNIEFPNKGLNRLVSIDAESLFEAGGLIGLIDSVKETLSSLGINCQLGDHNEEFDNETSVYKSRWIEISGIKYEMEGVRDWESAFGSGYILINRILENNNFDGRLFGLHMDETSTLIILNETQFEIIKESQKGKNPIIPIDLEELKFSS